MSTNPQLTHELGELARRFGPQQVATALADLADPERVAALHTAPATNDTDIDTGDDTDTTPTHVPDGPVTAPDRSYSLVEHARTELERLGEYGPDPDAEPAFAAAIVAAVAAFASYGHGGTSAEIGADLLARLLDRQNLTPLTSDPGEWIDRTAISNLPPGQTLWQAVRNPAAFSCDYAKTYWLVTDQDNIGDAEPDDDGMADVPVTPTRARTFYPTADPAEPMRGDSMPHLPPIDVPGPMIAGRPEDGPPPFTPPRADPTAPTGAPE